MARFARPSGRPCGRSTRKRFCPACAGMTIKELISHYLDPAPVRPTAKRITVHEILHAPFIDLQLGTVAVTDGAVGNPLTYILPLIAALILSMVIIPIMVRLAPRLGMMDRPDPRKVHATPIPRVGGVGIVFGTLIPLVLLLPIDQTLAAYLFGALVLFAFGAVDDCKEMGHYVKFIGQFIAVIVVVYYGNVYVSLLPFMGGEPVSGLWAAKGQGESGYRKQYQRRRHGEWVSHVPCAGPACPSFQAVARAAP